MFLKKTLGRLLRQDGLSPEFAQKIEDAILFGNVREIDDVLNISAIDDDFPKELRYGLEALRHFRAHYGPGCAMEPREPLQKQKATIMEIAWGAELLDILKQDH